MTTRAALISRTSSSRETRRARRWLLLDPSVVVCERWRDAGLERRRESKEGGIPNDGEDGVESRSVGCSWARLALDETRNVVGCTSVHYST